MKRSSESHHCVCELRPESGGHAITGAPNCEVKGAPNCEVKSVGAFRSPPSSEAACSVECCCNALKRETQ
jgi:hypothetical protein